MNEQDTIEYKEVISGHLTIRQRAKAEFHSKSILSMSLFLRWNNIKFTSTESS